MSAELIILSSDEEPEVIEIKNVPNGTTKYSRSTETVTVIENTNLLKNKYDNSNVRRLENSLKHIQQLKEISCNFKNVDKIKESFSVLNDHCKKSVTIFSEINNCAPNVRNSDKKQELEKVQFRNSKNGNITNTKHDLQNSSKPKLLVINNSPIEIVDIVIPNMPSTSKSSTGSSNSSSPRPQKNQDFLSALGLKSSSTESPPVKHMNTVMLDAPSTSKSSTKSSSLPQKIKDSQSSSDTKSSLLKNSAEPNRPSTSKSTTESNRTSNIQPHKKSSSKKDDTTRNETSPEAVSLSEEEDTKSMFQKLLDLCEELDKTEDMASIKNRLWRYYSQASPDFLSSKTFKSMLEVEIKKCKSKHIKHNAFLSLRNILEALKANPYMATTKLRKLQRMLEKVQKKIAKLEEEEVSSDDDNNAYIQLDRWNRRAVEIYQKICELMDKPADAERQYLRKVSFSGSGTNHVICRALEKYYNKVRKFPDFLDVKTLVQATNEKESLGLTPAQIHTTAEKIFLEFGTMLQRRRCYDDYSIMVEYIGDDVHDPALEDPALLKKLNDNKILYHGRESEVLEEYTKKELNRKSTNLDPNSNDDDLKNHGHERDQDDNSGDDCESDGEKMDDEEKELEEDVSNGENKGINENESKDEEDNEITVHKRRFSLSSDSDDDFDLSSKRMKLDTDPDISETGNCVNISENEKNMKNIINDKQPSVEIENENSNHPDIQIVDVVFNENKSYSKPNEKINSKSDDSLKKSNVNTSNLLASTSRKTSMIIELEDDNSIDLTQDEVLPPATPNKGDYVRLKPSSSPNDKPKTSSEGKSVGKSSQIIIEGKHPLILSEQSTIFLSRGAKIFKRFIPKPIVQDVIILD